MSGDWKRVPVIICMILVLFGIFPVPAVRSVPLFAVGCGMADVPWLVAEVGGERLLLISREKWFDGGVERSDYFVLDEGGVVKGCRNIHWRYEDGKITVLKDEGWGEGNIERFLLKAMKDIRHPPISNEKLRDFVLQVASELVYLSGGYSGNFVLSVWARDSDMCQLGGVGECDSGYRNWHFLRVLPITGKGPYYYKVGFTFAASGSEWEYEFKKEFGVSPTAILLDVAFVGGVVRFGNFINISSYWEKRSLPQTGLGVKIAGVGYREYSKVSGGVIFEIPEVIPVGWGRAFGHGEGKEAFLEIPSIDMRAATYNGDAYDIRHCWMSSDASPNRWVGCYLGREFFRGEAVVLTDPLAVQPRGWRIYYAGYAVVMTSDRLGHKQMVKLFPVAFDVEVGSPW